MYHDDLLVEKKKQSRFNLLKMTILLVTVNDGMNKV